MKHLYDHTVHFIVIIIAAIAQTLGTTTGVLIIVTTSVIMLTKYFFPAENYLFTVSFMLSFLHEKAVKKI